MPFASSRERAGRVGSGVAPLRRLAASLCLGMAAACCLLAPARGQNPDGFPTPDDSLKIYAVGTVKTRLFKRWVGHGIYLGHGAVITASHVLGRWPLNVNQRVLVDGQELPDKVIKQGEPEETDLALLSVDEKRLPISLRLRLNPVCKGMPQVGAEVVVVNPEGTARTHIISPMSIPAEYRIKYGAIIGDVAGAGSGSGVFDAARRCLLGIISRRILMGSAPNWDQGAEDGTVEYAKYFVPAPTIAKFIPAEFRF
jgi:hypothetical protein